MAFAPAAVQPGSGREECDPGPNAADNQPDKPKNDPITVRHTSIFWLHETESKAASHTPGPEAGDGLNQIYPS
jgi:hypothetical protein